VKAHRTDWLSLVFALVFLAITAWWLLAQLMNLALPQVGWILAVALIATGTLGLVGALRSSRTPATPAGTAPAPGLAASAGPDQTAATRTLPDQTAASPLEQTLPDRSLAEPGRNRVPWTESPWVDPAPGAPPTGPARDEPTAELRQRSDEGGEAPTTELPAPHRDGADGGTQPAGEGGAGGSAAEERPR
jgi:hypothetical protein